jgi:hypothetical protein
MAKYLKEYYLLWRLGKFIKTPCPENKLITEADNFKAVVQYSILLVGNEINPFFWEKES